MSNLIVIEEPYVQRHKPTAEDERFRRAVRSKLFDADPSCRYCGREFARPSLATIDHIQPLVSGGRDDYENLTLSCSECNSHKDGNSPATWHRRLLRMAAAIGQPQSLTLNEPPPPDPAPVPSNPPQPAPAVRQEHGPFAVFTLVLTNLWQPAAKGLLSIPINSPALKARSLPRETAPGASPENGTAS